MRVLSIALVVSACSYTPGALLRDPITSRRVGCLDVAVTPEPGPGSIDPVYAIAFGDRCAEPVRVRLDRVRVVARFADGHEVTLTPFDPGDVRPAVLEARDRGREVLEFLADPVDVDGATLCVDVGALDEDAPAGTPPVCFAAPEVIT